MVSQVTSFLDYFRICPDYLKLTLFIRKPTFELRFLTRHVVFGSILLVSENTQAPATASLRDLCCWLEPVALFGCLACLMVWRWQKPSGRIKAETSASEKGAARQRGPLHYKLTMAAPASSFFFYIYSAQQVSATAVSLPSLTPRGCFSPPYERKAWGKGGRGSCRLGLGT